MSNWFAERLGPPPGTVVARYQPGQPWPPQQQQPVYPQQGPPQQFVQYQPQGQQLPFDPHAVKIENAQQLLALKDYWGGTVEEKQNTEVCPKCGGPLQMYTGLNAPKIMNRDGVSCHPMERCHYCGYNGHFEQLGQQATDSGIAVRVI